MSEICPVDVRTAQAERPDGDYVGVLQPEPSKNVQIITCAVCGKEVEHYKMLSVTASVATHGNGSFFQQSIISSDSRHLCPDCAEKGIAFAKDPFTRTITKRKAHG